MRFAVVVGAGLVATGCAGDGAVFEHASQLEVSTRGVGVLPDGDLAHVSMYGTTCSVLTNSGQISHDFDYPSDMEAVQDGGWLLGEQAVVVVSPDAVHVNFPDRGWSWSGEDIDVSAVEARVSNDGVVGVTADCTVFWSDGETGDLTTTGVADCSATDLAVTPDGGAFISTEQGVFAVTESGAVSLDVTGDLLAWDEHAQVLYVATSGTGDLLGVEADGAVRWSVQVDGAITDITAMGRAASVAVMVETASAAGELLVFDGHTGAETSAMRTPSAAQQLQSSRDGSMLAMVLPRVVHFFQVGGAR